MPKAVSLFLIRYGTQFAARNVRYWHKADIRCVHCTCPLLGVKRTWRFALQMSAYDPKRTSTNSTSEPSYVLNLNRYEPLLLSIGGRNEAT